MQYLLAVVPVALGMSAVPSTHAGEAAPTFTVNSPFDVPAGGVLTNGICQTAADNTVCTLRAAIMKANRWPGGGVTINVPAGTYKLDIAGTTSDDSTGDFEIVQPMTIVGAGMAATILDANRTGRLFITGSSPLTVSDLTMANGTAAEGSLIYSGSTNLALDRVRITGGLGVALRTYGTVTVSDSVLDLNASPVDGGAILVVGGTATVNRTRIVDNFTQRSGGGIALVPVLANPSLTLNDVTIRGNHAMADGGGMYVKLPPGWTATVKILRTTFNANFADVAGGALANQGGATLSIENSTFSANSAQQNGGAVSTGSAISLFNTTIAGNLANADANGSDGGGAVASVSNSVLIYNTLLVENRAATDYQSCSGQALESRDYNFIPGGSCPYVFTGVDHNVTSGDAYLGRLRNNGGVTDTHALIAGSAAIDRVPTAECRDSVGVAPTKDQRNTQRPVGADCDIGAFEGSQPVPLIGSNLIRNGDAEAGGGSRTGGFVNIPYWLPTFGQPTTLRYDSPGGYPTIGNASHLIPATHGYNFLGGGNVGFSEALQAASVAAAGASIDAGTLKYTLSGDFGGFLTDNDFAELRATFKDGTGGQLGSPVSVGSISAADRGNKTGLIPASVTGNVPAGTRLIDLHLRFTRTAGVSNDGYADNLSLVLLPAHAIDADGNGSNDALTDGLLILRYLFGLRGDSLVAGAIGQGSTRSSGTDVEVYLDSVKSLLDIDGNGATDALTDGLMLIRYLFALRGSSLIGSALGQGATRTTAADIEAYIQSLL